MLDLTLHHGEEEESIARAHSEDKSTITKRTTPPAPRANKKRTKIRALSLSLALSDLTLVSIVERVIAIRSAFHSENDAIISIENNVYHPLKGAVLYISERS